ncbi:auxin-responsive protein SAUR62-like [Euphorbia lathyris]|uniref:auxin-responsive protein SAUR62-like n=1 Tax=Euphorbia lathyris TaxID=212925 RepID=UPI0033136CCD
MISAKKLLKLARKWQKLVAIKRKRITLPRTDGVAETSSCSTSTKVEKGHFVVYSADHERFVLPLQYLNNEIMRELFNLAEEEFGLDSDGPLTLPCEAEVMKYAIALIKKKVNRDVEKALLTSIASRCSAFHLQHQSTLQQLPLCSF